MSADTTPEPQTGGPAVEDEPLPSADEPAEGLRAPAELLTTDELPAVARHRTAAFKEAIAAPEQRKGLGTFVGVFRPTIMTILGVMMYLRLGWVVGEAGLLGALAVILLIFFITSMTALSLSSISTNVRVSGGGVFSIISRSLGLESGGSIGIPLYLAQALSAGLYLYGFTEAWTHLFPSHPQWVVLAGIFAVVSITTTFSSRLVFKLQGLVMWVVLASMTSIVLGLPSFETAHVDTFQTPAWWGGFEDGGFWYVFAVFFPAGTGIMVGAGLSDTLANPRRSIPRGTMFAVLVAFLVYVSLAIWYGVMATPEELRGNYLIVAERAAWGPLVFAGIMASTFTAALSSLVAAPRVLRALAEHRILPRSDLFVRSTRSGDPWAASLFTGGLVGSALLLGSLDRVAVLITMFFLLTYLIVNVVVLIEQSLAMVSFRPRFKIPIIVPIMGTLGCSMAFFIISPTFALVAIALVVGIYVWLINRDLDTPWETVRSSIFVSVVDWAARKIAGQQHEHHERSWKPDLLVPVTTRAQLDGNFRFLRSITFPKGSIQVVGVAPEKQVPAGHLDQLGSIARAFQDHDLYATAVVINSADLVRGVRHCCAVMAGSHFRPNILYALVQQHSEETLQGLLDTSIEYSMGAAFLQQHPEAGFGHERDVNVWVRDQSPDWHLGLRLANLDLAILSAYQVWRNWGGRLRLLTVVANAEDAKMAEVYLNQLIEDARLPKTTETWVHEGRFMDVVSSAPHADLNVIGMAPTLDKELLEELSQKTGSSILYVRDSGRESALA